MKNDFFDNAWQGLQHDEVIQCLFLVTCLSAFTACILGKMIFCPGEGEYYPTAEADEERLSDTMSPDDFEELQSKIEEFGLTDAKRATSTDIKNNVKSVVSVIPRFRFSNEEPENIENKDSKNLEKVDVSWATPYHKLGK